MWVKTKKEEPYKNVPQSKNLNSSKKNCLEANQLESEINLKVKFRNEKHDVFTEEAHKIVLPTVTETNAYGTSKDIIRKNNQIIYNSIIT